MHATYCISRDCSISGARLRQSTRSCRRRFETDVPRCSGESEPLDIELKKEDLNGNRPKKVAAKRSKKAVAVRDDNYTKTETSPLMMIAKPLPRVLLLHTGGTLGMDPEQSFEFEEGCQVPVLKQGTGGVYGGLKPGDYLNNLLQMVPELKQLANIDLKVVFNKDSSRVGPKEWQMLARLLHSNRNKYDAFLIVHGTDTMSYTASALSLMLVGFKKPIVLTGSQLPLRNTRTDARTNLIDAITCATSYFTPPHVYLQEVGVCFGGNLLRGNRSQKVDSTVYQAFKSPSYPPLAVLGVSVEWNTKFMLQVEGVYRPRFELDTRVIRVPIVPGSDPRVAYGDLVGRGVKGIVLEAFGVGNMPDLPVQGWLPWLKAQRQKGLMVYLASQCVTGALHPELYRAGSVALALGVQAGPKMTPECAVVKMMLCLSYPDLPLGLPLAGEM